MSLSSRNTENIKIQDQKEYSEILTWCDFKLQVDN